MLSNRGAGEDSWESFGQQGDYTSQSQRKSTLNIYWKDWCWSWSSNTLAIWCEEQTHWKRLWFWERLKAAGEGDDRGWGGWMASLTRCTWVWANCGRQWSTGKPGVLQSMGWQSDATEWLHNNKSIWQYMTLGTTLLIMPFTSIYHLPSHSPRLAPCPLEH